VAGGYILRKGQNWMYPNQLYTSGVNTSTVESVPNFIEKTYSANNVEVVETFNNSTQFYCF
jgi:hypothetical protein